MAELDTEPDPDSESQIWRLTGFGAGFGFLVFGSGFRVNFSDSAHLWWLQKTIIELIRIGR